MTPGANNTFSYSSVKIDSSYQFGREEDHRIHAIAHIPASDYLIFSSNRFKIIKADRKTGKIVKNVKNPLDKIGMYAIPCLSHRTDLDPFNPTSEKDPELSKRMLNKGAATHMIVVGAGDPMNAIVDWATMKPVKFFSMHLEFVKASGREENIIGSIDYYGGIPQGKYYLLSTVGPTSNIYAYSGIYGKIIKEFSWGIISRNKVVSWIYGTIYFSVFYPEPLSGGYKPILNVAALFGDRIENRHFNQRLGFLESYKVDKFEMALLYLEMGKLPSEPEYWLHRYYEPDSMYLAIYNRSNSIRVQPPSIYWDFCHPRPHLQHGGTEYLMFIGRMMTCPNQAEYISQTPEFGNSGFCTDGLEDVFHPILLSPLFPENFFANDTVVTCRRKICQPGKLPHYFDLSFTIGSFQIPVGIYCVEKFELDQNMKGFANDNGCSSSFNKNPFGICQNCRSTTSDCLIFGSLMKDIDMFTFDMFSYEYSMYGKPLYYKDYREKTHSGQWTKIGEAFDQLNTTLINMFNNVYIWKFQNRALTTQCYILEPDLNDPKNYLVDAKAEYILDKASKYEKFDVMTQNEEINNGTLTGLVCIKGCEVGYFYEFASISCRKCALGCGVCKSFDECERCFPGFNQIQKSETHKDVQEDYPVGLCRPGCQPGFYPRSFDGTCRECPADCLSCRDKVAFEVTMSKELGMTNDMYCIQCREKHEDGRLLYSQSFSGKCIPVCEGFGTFVLEFVSKTTNKPYRKCGRCFDPHCKDCQKSDAVDSCIACADGFTLDDDSKCVDYWSSRDGILMLSFLIFSGIALVVVIGFAGFIIWLKNAQDSDNINLKKASMSVKRAYTQQTLGGDDDRLDLMGDGDNGLGQEGLR